MTYTFKNKSEYQHVLDALKDAFVEFEELVHEKEWYCTEVTDRLESAMEIMESLGEA